MDSQQTPRASQDPVAGRGSPMVKENPTLPSGFQARPQGPPPLSPRFPLNNGSVGRPRLPGGQQPPYLDHRPNGSLGSPVAPPGPYVQIGPPYGGPLTPNPQGTPAQPTRPLNPTNSGPGHQGPAWRYPVVPGSSPALIRPHSNNFVGPRPPVFAAPNQSPQRPVNYQPRNGPGAEIRPRRPINLDSVGTIQPPPGQIRFSSVQQNSEPRRSLQQQSMNETPMTSVPSSGQLPRVPPQATIRQGLQGEKIQSTDSPSPTPSDGSAAAAARASETLRGNNLEKHGQSSRAENEDNDDDDVVMDNDAEIYTKNAMTLNDYSSRPGSINETAARQTENIRVPDSPGSRSSYEKSNSPSPARSMDIHQDSPIKMDTMAENSMEKRPTSVESSYKSLPVTTSPLPTVEQQDRSGSSAKLRKDIDERSGSERSYENSPAPSPIPPPVSAKQQHPSGSIGDVEKDADERPGSKNSYGKSSTPSPSPNPSIASMGKVENYDEPPGPELMISDSSIEPAAKLDDTTRGDSRLADSKSPDQSHEDYSMNSQDNETILRAHEAIEEEVDRRQANDERNDSRASDVESSRSPTVKPQTPTLSVPLSSSSRSSSAASPKSPKSPKSPLGSVKGFDNGRLRSLSPKSPVASPSIGSASRNSSPVSPNSPNSSAAQKSREAEGKKTSFAENETEIEMVGERSKEKSSNGMRTRPATPGCEIRGKQATPTKILERARTPATPDGRESSSVKRSTSGRSIKSDAGSESGTDETNRTTPTTNGVALSPTKKLPSKSRDNEERTTAGSPIKSPSKSLKSLPRTPETAGPPSTAEKKIPMNKVQVGAAPSPNLKTVRSKIGSLDNASYKPGGGKVKIENRKLDFSKAQPKIAAKNDKYAPSGGDKKITRVKLQWNAKPKVGSLDNATYKPGGGDKKIETVKLDFKDKAKPKVGSKDNAKHVPGGGTVKSSSTPPKTPQDSSNDIETRKVDVKAESKIGSLDNVKHKPGGGDKKIFDDRDYLRQQTAGSNVESLNGSGAQIEEPVPTLTDSTSSIENNSTHRFLRRGRRRTPEPNPPPSTPTRTIVKNASTTVSPVTPLTPPSTSGSRKNLQKPKSPVTPTNNKKVTITPDASSTTSKSSASASPKGFRLPELTTHYRGTTIDDNQAAEAAAVAAAMAKEESNVKLPKLIETPAALRQSGRLELAK